VSTTNNRRTTGDTSDPDADAGHDPRSDREWLQSIESELRQILGHQG
jgi:hypothetical protein